MPSPRNSSLKGETLSVACFYVVSLRDKKRNGLNFKRDDDSHPLFLAASTPKVIEASRVDEFDMLLIHCDDLEEKKRDFSTQASIIRRASR